MLGSKNSKIFQVLVPKFSTKRLDLKAGHKDSKGLWGFHKI